MKLNRIELKKVLYEFNSFSNRLLLADFRDYLDVLKKYIAYLKSTPIIIEFINDCGECEQDIVQKIKEVNESYGDAIFDIGNTQNEEIRNVFAILQYIADNNIEIYYGITMGYSHSDKYQDKIKGFNERFVMVLIRHIENFLTKAGIEMEIDEKATYNVTVRNGQAIFTGDNATITATNNVGIDTDKLNELISKVREYAVGFSDEDAEAMNESLEAIEEEAQSEKPKKSIIKMAVKALSALKGTAEFTAAVVALIEFISNI